jgi:aconitase B
MEDWITNGTLLKADADAKSGEIYRYMNFDQIPPFVEAAATVEM